MIACWIGKGRDAKHRCPIATSTANIIKTAIRCLSDAFSERHFIVRPATWLVGQGCALCIFAALEAEHSRNEIRQQGVSLMLFQRNTLLTGRRLGRESPPGRWAGGRADGAGVGMVHKNTVDKEGYSMGVYFLPRFFFGDESVSSTKLSRRWLRRRWSE